MISIISFIVIRYRPRFHIPLDTLAACTANFFALGFEDRRSTDRGGRACILGGIWVVLGQSIHDLIPRLARIGLVVIGGILGGNGSFVPGRGERQGWDCVVILRVSVGHRLFEYYYFINFY